MAAGRDGKLGAGEIQYHEPDVTTVKRGQRGGLEQCADQTRVLESGLKGAAGTAPGNEDTAGSVDTRCSKWDDHDGPIFGGG